MAELSKMIAIPVDGSENALKSMDYLNLMYGPEHNFEVNIFYVLPSLPLTPAEDPTTVWQFGWSSCRRNSSFSHSSVVNN